MGYVVNEGGEVVSPRNHKRLKLQEGTNGYLHFSVGTNGDGNRGVVMVHRLAAYYWFGEMALGEGIEVRHLDGDKRNNSRENIVLGSKSDNSFDIPREERVRHSLHAVSKQRKLTFAEAKSVRSLYRGGGHSFRSLADKFSVCPATIGKIVRGDSYRISGDIMKSLH